MHNSTSDISDEVIQKLNDSANRKRINKFRGAFNKLSHYDKEYYSSFHRSPDVIR